jgi:hypothetical protein
MSLVWDCQSKIQVFECSVFGSADRNQADMVLNLDNAEAILNLLELTQNIHPSNLKVGKKLHINMK